MPGPPSPRVFASTPSSPESAVCVVDSEGAEPHPRAAAKRTESTTGRIEVQANVPLVAKPSAPPEDEARVSRSNLALRRWRDTAVR